MGADSGKTDASKTGAAAKSASRRPDDDDDDAAPGPGSYTPSPYSPGGAGLAPRTFPRELRATDPRKKTPAEKFAAQVPGPGSYRPPGGIARDEAASGRRNAPVLSFGTTHRDPSPGGRASRSSSRRGALWGGSWGRGPRTRRDRRRTARRCWRGRAPRRLWGSRGRGDGAATTRARTRTTRTSRRGRERTSCDAAIVSYRARVIVYHIVVRSSPGRTGPRTVRHSQMVLHSPILEPKPRLAPTIDAVPAGGPAPLPRAFLCVFFPPLKRLLEREAGEEPPALPRLEALLERLLRLLARRHLLGGVLQHVGVTAP